MQLFFSLKNVYFSVQPFDMSGPLSLPLLPILRSMSFARADIISVSSFEMNRLQTPVYHHISTTGCTGVIN